MAQQQPLISTNLVTENDIRKLWQDGNTGIEESCQIVWTNICNLLFQLGTYSVVRESRRGPYNHWKEHIIDVVVERLNPPQGNNLPTLTDILWIECKPADNDQPAKWRDLFDLTARKLHSAQFNEPVYFVAAVGRKFMLLAWDPNRAGAPMRIRLGHATVNNPTNAPVAMDRRFCPVANVPSPWLNNNTGEVDTRQALTLCNDWSQTFGLHLVNLTTVENFLQTVMGTNRTRINPAHWK